MGVTLDLRMIDHDHVVEHGVVAVNEAISNNDASILAKYIRSLPFTPNQESIAYRQARCARLREVDAPEMPIQTEERLLRLVNGEAYSRDELSRQSLDELRHLLGTWGWAENSFNIDKLWSALDWFLQPVEGPDDFPMHVIRPKVGDAGQSLLDQALKGSEQSPLDDSGMPIIRTCGSEREDCYGYNPPSKVAEIVLDLNAIDPETWGALVARRIGMFKKSQLEIEDETIRNIVADELKDAREALGVLQAAYNTANDRRFGIACEFSL